MKIRQLTLTALFTALIAVGAFIKIPLPLIPITLQTLFTSLAGMILGKKYGALSVFLYVFIGLLGIPVFTGGGGLSYVLKPTFGYLIGFCAGTYLTGAIARNKSVVSFKRLLCAGFCGMLVIYVCGMLYYYFIATLYMGKEVGFRSLLLNCFLITLPGDIILNFLSAALSKKLIPLCNKYI